MGGRRINWSSYMRPIAEEMHPLDRAAQRHVEGRFVPRERHERTIFTNTQGRSDPAREAVSTHRPGEATAEPDRGPSKVGTKSAAHPTPDDNMAAPAFMRRTA